MSDIFDEAVAAVEDLSIAPLHDGIKNMPADDFALLAVAIILFIIMIVGWALSRGSSQVCQHRCAIHTSDGHPK